MVEPLEQLLEEIVLLTTFCLEAISVLCVVVGLFKTALLAARLIQRHRGDEFPFNQVRLRFGLWLALALEFQLGADILSTTVAPTTQDLIKLALIAVIRTFLNYFLGREMATEMALVKEQRQLDKDVTE
ncbi:MULTISPECIES: DUF1622 domain-containing protein [Cyanophyceae]|uniref:DUF1622 domain-containing protein n=1 Tax=Leptolyngbya subtilissima DQ-A4 TaxID=2933933 RepID=A0ABV0K6V5_9CYAN|nr:DUF1622 domain-containing protein [Nodosilinea sp. FACHB-141]MBD2113664.1 DUF1622 domain-containing protein [Nodosilinea sp. FACHB-141]